MTELTKAIKEATEAGIALLKSQMALPGFGTTNLTKPEIMRNRKDGIFTKPEARQMFNEAHHKEYDRTNASGTVSHIQAKGTMPPHIQKIHDRMKQLNKLSKDELIRMHPSRLDKTHMKGQSTDKYSIRNGILENEFGRKKLQEYDNHMSGTVSNIAAKGAFDRISAAHGSTKLHPDTHGKNIMSSVEKLKAQGHITGDQRDSINATISEAGTRGKKFKFGDILNKIDGNDHAAEYIRRNLAG